MRFWTKVLKCNFSNLNQEVLGTLQKFIKAKNKRFYTYVFAIFNKEEAFLASKLLV